jgi:hypothetical protein
MFSYAMNKSQGLYVGLYSGNTNEDADYERCLTSMEELDAATKGLPQGLLAVLVTDPGTPGVPPAWRRRMADFNRNVKSSPYFMSIVTMSMVLRGALTLINWLAPPKEGHALVAHADFEQACQWAESVRGTHLPLLSSLLAEARAQSTSR